MSIGLKGAWKSSKGCRLKHRIKRTYWDIRYAWQRAWNGYDYQDIFNMDNMFVKRYISILNDYNKCRHCVFNVPKQYRDVFGKLFFTDEQTKVIIDMMIFHLEMMDEDYVEKMLYGKNIYDDDYDFSSDFSIERSMRISDIVDQNKELFMEMFNVFFWELWD